MLIILLSISLAIPPALTMLAGRYVACYFYTTIFVVALTLIWSPRTAEASAAGLALDILTLVSLTLLVLSPLLWLALRLKARRLAQLKAQRAARHSPAAAAP